MLLGLIDALVIGAIAFLRSQKTTNKLFVTAVTVVAVIYSFTGGVV